MPGRGHGPCPAGAPARQPAGQEIFRDADGPREAQLLVDHPDAVALCQRRGVEKGHPAVDGDLAGIVVERAREDFHQGGFARAVLPHQGVDFSGLHLEAYVVNGNGAGETFAHMPHLERLPG